MASKILSFGAAAALFFYTATAAAGEWMRNVEVTQLGTYQHGTTHFI